MPLSVTTPIQPAIDQTRKVLFSPFDLGNWLVLGFCQFLVALGGGGNNFNFNYNFGGGPGGPGGGPGGPDFQPVIDWFKENAGMVAAIVGGALLLMLALAMLFTWLGSRGSFMFLDGVVRARGAVGEPWHEYRREANSLFWFRFLLVLAGLLVLVVLLPICGLIAWPDLKQQQMGGAVMLATVVAVLGILGFSIVLGLVRLFLKDFVVPIMYLQRISTVEAWRVFNSEMLPGNVGTLAIYVLIKILIACITLAAVQALTCVTCCIAALPYISSVCLLPLTVFERSYSVYFIRQYGPQWNVFPVEEDFVPPDLET